MRKAQISTEFLMAIGIILLIFFLLLFFSFEKKSEIRKTEFFLGKRAECQKVSNIISSVYAGGDGTEARFKTEYLITVFNNSLITVEEVANITIEKMIVAYLIQGTAVEHAAYLNDAFMSLNPDIYCSKITGSASNQLNNGCKGYDSLATLLENLDDYNVIYMEDSHIVKENYDEVWTPLLNWVAKGNILAVSEHMVNYCFDVNVLCLLYKIEISQEDILGVTWHYRGFNPGDSISDPDSILAIVVNEDPRYDLVKGDKLFFEEIPYVTDPLTGTKTVSSGILTGNYSDSGGRYSDTFEDDFNYWYFGSTRGNYDITAYAELTYNLSGIAKEDVTNLKFAIRYCHSGSATSLFVKCDGDAIEGVQQGSQDVEVYNYSSSQWVDIGDLRINDNGYEINDVYSLTGKITDYISNENLIRVRYKLDYYNNAGQDSWLVIDHAVLDVDSTQGEGIVMPIAEYDDPLGSDHTAIGYWPYGKGMITYFSDFNTMISSGADFGEIVAEHLKKVYRFIHPVEESDITCTILGRSQTYYELTGDLLVRNENNYIIVENATAIF